MQGGTQREGTELNIVGGGGQKQKKIQAARLGPCTIHFPSAESLKQAPPHAFSLSPKAVQPKSSSSRPSTLPTTHRKPSSTHSPTGITRPPNPSQAITHLNCPYTNHCRMQRNSILPLAKRVNGEKPGRVNQAQRAPSSKPSTARKARYNLSQHNPWCLSKLTELYIDSASQTETPRGYFRTIA